MPDSIVGNEFLPNVHIEAISYQEIEDRSVANIDIAIYDYKQRTWSLDSKFTGYLLINLAYFTGRNLINSIKQGNTLLSDAFPIDTSLYPRTQGVNTVNHFSSLTESDIILEGISYKKYKKTISMPLPTIYGNLSFFANTSIDLQTLKDNEALNLSYALQAYSSPVTGEDVLRDGNRVEKSNLFYDDDGNRWAGPVHLHPDRGYMEGSKHVMTTHSPLTLDSDVPNAKVRFLPSLSYRTDAVPVRNLEAPPSNPYLTYEQGYVQDSDGDVSCAFMADLYNLSLQESRVASIIQDNDPGTFQRIAQNLNIKNIEVNRHTLKRTNFLNSFNLPIAKVDMTNSTLIAKSFNNNKKVKEREMYRMPSREKLSVGSIRTIEEENILKDGIKIGTVKQLNLTLPKNIRPISFTDHEIKSIRGLEYGYSFKVQIEDDFLKYVKNLLSELTSYASRLQNFYNLLEAKNAYDGDKFKIDFLTSYYGQYGIEIDEATGTITSEIDKEKLKNIFIFKAFRALMEAEKLIGVQIRGGRLLESFNLFTTSMDAMNKAIRYYDKMIDRFTRVYSIGVGKSYGKTNARTARKDRPLIEKSIKLKKTYKKPILPKIGFNYISMTKHKGVKRVSLNDLTARADVEVKKYFKSPPTKASSLLANLNESDKKDFIDLATNKFKHFSPSKVFFGKKEVDTTSLNPESMEVNFFNNLKITRTLMEGTTEEEYSLRDIDEEQNLYIDSRDYLGDETKFNNAILRTLRRNPLRLIKIRKEFKLLDKSILKQKTKKISLDSFDLSSKNNIVKKAFSKAPKEVPIQIKALSMLRSESTNFDVKNLQFDPLANPQTDEVIKQNFMNIGKLEYLDGFETVSGIPLLNKPIFKEISLENLQQLQNKNVLCQIKNTNFDNLTIDDSQNFQIFDKTFTLESTEEDQIDIGEVQPMSQDNSDLVEIFSDTILPPVFYSSTIISQNPNNTSLIDPLKTSDQLVETTRTATVQTNIQTVQPAPRGGSY